MVGVSHLHAHSETKRNETMRHLGFLGHVDSFLIRYCSSHVAEAFSSCLEIDLQGNDGSPPIEVKMKTIGVTERLFDKYTCNAFINQYDTCLYTLM